MRVIVVLVTAMVIGLGANATAEIPYAGTPDWLSSENDDYGTGCDFGDVDGDGSLDLAVSNGNDIIPAANYVYLNSGGSLPPVASWSSGDQRYSGHCELADINNDGYPELMVANYIATDWQPAQVQIYSNSGGVLSSLPTWESANPIHTFRASFGDPDGDGDLDLAVATGESYYGIYQANCIYFNQGGVLETSPSWVSADLDASYDVKFLDVDNDGDLDVAFLTGSGPVKIYYNQDGNIATSPGWVTSDSDNGNSFDFADVNGDGYLDLAVANNTQLSGSGYHKLYLSDQGNLHATADWVSASAGYGSAAVFADVDSDGDEDLVTGRWWGTVEVYANSGGVFADIPDWSSSPAYESVVENIVFADLDDAATRDYQQTFPGDGQQRLFYLDDRHLQSVDQVVVDGLTLPLATYCYHRQAGWVSLAAAPLVSVTVFYRCSQAKDMAVSNWDNSTYLFSHDNVSGVQFAASTPESKLTAPTASPNPFNARTTISFILPISAPTTLELFDMRGRRVQVLMDANLEAGEQVHPWEATRLPSGLYLLRLQSGGVSRNSKIYLVK
ncbi:MAG: FG-GAP-like repeat-containing protein [bacterium]